MSLISSTQRCAFSPLALPPPLHSGLMWDLTPLQLQRCEKVVAADAPPFQFFFTALLFFLLLFLSMFLNVFA